MKKRGLSRLTYFLFVFNSMAFSLLIFVASIRFPIKIGLTGYSLTIVGIIYISYAIFRSVSAALWIRKISSTRKEFSEKKLDYKVGISVAVFNEELKDFEKMLKSCLNQNHRNLHIYIVEDGSQNQSEIRKLSKKYQKEGHPIFFHGFRKNKGKREAMHKSFLAMEKDEVDFVVTIDSDTVLEKSAIRILLSTITSNEKYGSVTGHVLSRNILTGNILQKMIGIRYLMAFNWERASQSNFGEVNCNSGPLTIYRMGLISHVKEKFVTQTFMSKRTTYGDDRHLTNRILALGYKTAYQPFAYAFTDTPSKYKVYMKQQLRWSKSYIRELMWQFRILDRHSPAMKFEYFMHIVLPFFITFSVGMTTLNIISFSCKGCLIIGDDSISRSVVVFLVTIVLMAFLKGAFLKLYLKKKVIRHIGGYQSIIRYTLLYAALYMSVLIFLKPYAALTIANNKWSTR